ncbi:hypothetical protein T265_04353 [Opisthorchis viverrini]|uniref:Uncharacterized protein n=1 Tax=Opisthorchis viverrini TaxID=6198 RepID=A0A075AGM9_OPIVI|nr:hypothetical protein T265_04353 [Opisthorchis viverrini]KER28884.1 hypothetical protein T265_04353 [Opisthorchis viverrini]
MDCGESNIWTPAARKFEVSQTQQAESATMMRVHKTCTVYPRWSQVWAFLSTLVVVMPSRTRLPSHESRDSVRVAVEEIYTVSLNSTTKLH